MERALSIEDKIRKAEEIYYRRNNIREPKVVINSNKKDIKYVILKKLTIQTLASVSIFTGVFLGLNNEIYSSNVKKIINELLMYNIDLQALYKQITVKNEENTKVENNIEQQEVVVPEEENKEEVLDIDIENKEETVDPMQENAEYIKQNISMIKPLEGVITSRYGARENVKPFFHTGIDIAANTGTKIAAAMDGVAEVVSTEGSYGNHIKIVSGEIATLYAHCNKLYINQGDNIKQGEIIAEVGSTGNSTGPHLHFEIIRNGEFIDPDLILSF